jgi:hypothetical protein
MVCIEDAVVSGMKLAVVVKVLQDLVQRSVAISEELRKNIQTEHVSPSVVCVVAARRSVAVVKQLLVFQGQMHVRFGSRLTVVAVRRTEWDKRPPG